LVIGLIVVLVRVENVNEGLREEGIFLSKFHIPWNEGNTQFEYPISELQHFGASEWRQGYLKYLDLSIFWQTGGNTSVRKY
jgi:hypothetical protein